MESFDDLWWIPLTILFALSLWVVRRTSSARHSSSLRVHALRLSPRQEVKSTLFEFCRRNSIDAACILTCVGSLSKAHLRYAYSADQQADMEEWSKGQVVNGQFEILSLVGTVSDEGSSGHLHICLGDDNGGTRGGHLIGDAVVRTTAEIVLGQCTSLKFIREHDVTTGFPELVVKKKFW